MDELARMILDVKNVGVGTSLSDGFIKAAMKATRVKEVAPVKEKGEVDPVTVEKINYLKSCEECNHIGWFSYSSWNMLPDACKEMVKETTNPLFWGGVYFDYDKFIESKDFILEGLTNREFLFIVKTNKSLEFCVVSADDDSPSWLGIQKFRALRKHYESNMVVVYFREDGKIMSKLGKRYGESYPT